MRSGSLRQRHGASHDLDTNAIAGQRARRRRARASEHSPVPIDVRGDNDWLAEFPDEPGSEPVPSAAAPSPALPSSRKPLWTVIQHEAGPAWPAPPAALEPPMEKPSTWLSRAWPIAAARLRASRTRPAVIGGVSIGILALAGVLVYAATRGQGSAPPEPEPASSPAPPSQVSAPPAVAGVETLASAAVNTRDRAALDAGAADGPGPSTNAPATNAPSNRNAAVTPPPARTAGTDVRGATGGGAPADSRRDNPPASRPPATETSPKPTPTATPVAPPPTPTATVPVRTGTATLPGQEIVPPVVPPPRPTPSPSPAPPAARDAAGVGARETAPPPAVPSESSLVQSVLDRYRVGYSTLNVGAVAAAWPSVNARALERAFGQLESQRFEFTNCRIDVEGAQAQAACTGTASFVPKVGDRTRRSERREWAFTLVRVSDGWIIRRVETR